MNKDGNKRLIVDDWKSNLREKRLKMSGAQAKTSITILQEKCAKMNPKDLPIYTELSEVPPEYEDQNLRFFIRCQALGMSTIGGGTTKRIAKHSAAEKLISKYFRPNRFEEDDDEVIQTPDVNFISDLMDFCVLKDYHKPEFSLVTSCGPSHAPTFTIECKLNSITRTGTAGNKTQAKQLAAKEVLDILKSSYPDIEKKVAVVNGANQTKEIIRQKVTSYLDLKKRDKVDQMGKIIKDRYRFFRTQDEEFVETFSSLLSSEKMTDDEKYLKLLDELETMWEYKIEKIEDTELWKFELLIDFDKFTCCIIADSDEKLKSEVLQYFMEMMSINIPQSCETTFNILGELVIENL